jgi:hypothetical protein
MANSEWRMANSGGFLCDPRGQPPAGRTCSVTGFNVCCPNVGAAFQRPRVHRRPAFGEGASRAVLRLGRNKPQLGCRGQRKHVYPHFAQSPSASATGFALVNRSPLRADGNRRVLHFSLLCRASTLVGPIDYGRIISLCPGCIAGCLMTERVASANASWAVQFMCIAEDSCAGLCKNGMSVSDMATSARL